MSILRKTDNAYKLIQLHRWVPGPHTEYPDNLIYKNTLYMCVKCSTDIAPFFVNLSQRYVPTFLWGKSGHLQTTTYAKVGRFNAPRPEGERFSYIMPDGATCTFDVFEPTTSHRSGGNPFHFWGFYDSRRPVTTDRCLEMQIHFMV